MKIIFVSYDPSDIRFWMMGINGAEDGCGTR